MRIISLFALFFVGLYFFLPRSEKGHEIDAIKTKVSAIKREPLSQPRRHHTFKQNTPSFQSETASENSAVGDSMGDEDMPSDEPVAQSVPWSDVEQGWHNELKDLLVRLDPEDGEALFTAYLSEKETYQAEVDNLFREKQNPEGRAPVSEFDTQMSELDRKHEEKLKEILGGHYEEVTQKHEEYISSVQYLNRGSEEIGISL